jgi:catechol 2,3-dioxygenase-like lactoylglutathione lyase family enzyme
MGPLPQTKDDTTELRLELIAVPVSDVDRAKAFYAERAGFDVDHDQTRDGIRFVQLTPPGSACSIALSELIAASPPGSLQGLQLVVSDVEAARAHLVENGVDVGEVQVFDSGSFRPRRDGDALDNVGFAFFSDPDGNGWALQQIRPRSQP